jgi:hypothetical protein
MTSAKMIMMEREEVMAFDLMEAFVDVKPSLVFECRTKVHCLCAGRIENVKYNYLRTVTQLQRNGRYFNHRVVYTI